MDDTTSRTTRSMKGRTDDKSVSSNPSQSKAPIEDLNTVFEDESGAYGGARSKEFNMTNMGSGDVERLCVMDNLLHRQEDMSEAMQGMRSDMQTLIGVMRDMALQQSRHGDPSVRNSRDQSNSSRDMTPSRVSRGRQISQRGRVSSSSSVSSSRSTGRSAVNSRQNSRNRFSNAKLPPYSGKEKWEVWYNRFKEVARLRSWNDDQRLDELLPRLQGPAGEFVYSQLSHRVRTNYQELIKELNSRFRVVETKKTFGAQFSHRGQKAGETVEEYAAELKRLYDKAHANRDTMTRQEDLLRKFLDGLHDERARFHIEYVKDPQDIDQAVYEAVNFQETRRKPLGREFGSDKLKGDRKAVRAMRQTSDTEDENSHFSDNANSDDDCREKVARVPSKVNKGKTIKASPNTSSPRAATDVSEQSKGVSKGDNKTDSNQEIISKLDNMNTAISDLNDRVKKLEIKPKWSRNGNRNVGQNKKNDGQSSQVNGGFLCFKCGQEGHFARTCPNVPWVTGQMHVAVQPNQPQMSPVGTASPQMSQQACQATVNTSNQGLQAQGQSNLN